MPDERPAHDDADYAVTMIDASGTAVATAYIAARLRRMIKHLGGPEAPDNTGLQVAYLLICDSVRRYAGGLGKVSQDDIDRAIAFYGDESVDPITEA